MGQCPQFARHRDRRGLCVCENEQFWRLLDGEYGEAVKTVRNLTMFLFLSKTFDASLSKSKVSYLKLPLAFQSQPSHEH